MNKLILFLVLICTINVNNIHAQCPGSAISFTYTTTQASCPSDGSITITTSGGVSPFAYEITSPIIKPSQNSNIFSGLSAETYTIKITDNCGTEFTAQATVGGSYQDLMITPSADLLNCPADNNGEIEVATAGGASPIQYAIVSPSPTTVPQQSSNIFSNLTAGTYYIEATDNCGTVRTSTYQIDVKNSSIPQLSSNFFAWGDKYACDSVYYDLDLKSAPFDFVEPLQYALIGGSLTLPPQTSNEFYLPQGGDFTFEVTDGCGRSTSAIIGSDPKVTYKFSATCDEYTINPQFNLATLGNSTFQIDDGSGPSAPQNSGTFQNLTPGTTYTVITTDECGSSTSTLVSLAPIEELSVNDHREYPLCDTPLVRKTISPNNTGGSFNLYHVSGPTVFDSILNQTANGFPYTLPDLSVGSYEILLVGACGDSVYHNFDITESYQDSPTYTIENTCSGANITDFNLNYNDISFWKPQVFNSLILNNDTAEEANIDFFNNLSPGEYTIKSRIESCDSLFTYTPITITAPTPPVLDLDGVYCKNAQFGDIHASASNGSEPYQYEIIAPFNSGLQADSFFIDLVPQTYQVRVTDACGNATVDGLELTTFNTNSVDISLPACEGGLFSASADYLPGGTYNWSGPNGFTSSDREFEIDPFTLNDTGTYSLHIFKPACIDTTINLGAYLGGSNSLSIMSSDFCLSSTNTIIINGNTGGAFSFEELPTDGATINTITGEISNATLNNHYIIRYEVSNGSCSQFATDTSNVLAQTNSSINITDTTCSSAGILAFSSPDIGKWYASCANCIDVTTGEFNTSLADLGMNYITFIPDNECTLQSNDSVFVKGSSTPIYSIPDTICQSIDSVLLTTNVVGTWSANCNNCLNSNGMFYPSTTINNIQIEFTGTNPCDNFIDSIYVKELQVTEITTENSLCKELGSYNPSINILGGSWTATCGTCINETDGTFNTLQANEGTNTIYYNLNNCSTADSAVIEVTTFIDSITSESITCHGLNNGSITLHGASPIDSFIYSFTGIQNLENSNQLLNLDTNTYFISTIWMDGISCPINQSVLITQPDSISISFATANISCNGSNNGNIIGNVQGGTSPYTYEWNTGDLSANIQNLDTGNYIITVTDANGCVNFKGETITEPDNLSLNIATVNSDCSTGNGSITFETIFGGTPSYSFNWSHDNTLGFGVANNLLPGTYTITVSDQNNCDTIVMVSVSPKNTPAISITSENASCYSYCDGNAAIQLQIPYNGVIYYNWSNNETTNPATNLCAGNQIVTVTFENGCSRIDSTFINSPDSIIISSTNDTTICVGSEATIQANAIGGSGNYTYSWSNQFIGAGPHNFSPTENECITVSITDENNCPTEPSTICVNLYDSLNLALNSLNEICEGSEVTLTASTTGGNPNNSYIYSWSNTNSNSNSISTNVNYGDSVVVSVSDGCSPEVSLTNMFAFYPTTTTTITPDSIKVCIGEEVSLSLNSTNNTISSIIWNMDDNTQYNLTNNITHTYQQADEYNVSVSLINEYGCEDSLFSVVHVQESPIADFISIYENPSQVFSNMNVNFSDYSTGEIKYWEWNVYGPSDTTMYLGENFSFNFEEYLSDYNSREESFSVSLTVLDSLNCKSEITKSVTFSGETKVYIPNTFSPNQDVWNNTFGPEYFGFIENYALTIFDRWGDKVFTSEDINFRWDGTFKGTDCKQDVYTWQMSYQDIFNENVMRSGIVTLIR